MNALFDFTGDAAFAPAAKGPRLPWQEETAQEIMGRRCFVGWESIVAHAPSTVRLSLHAPAEIVGLLNCSAYFDPDISAEFWADHNFIGETRRAGDETKSIRLPAGEHVLHVRASREGGRHTVWLVRQIAASAACPGCFPENTAVVTIGCYPQDRLSSALNIFGRSAARHGVWIQPLGAGESYGSHYQAKIVRLRAWLASVEADYVLYIDGRDALFCGDLPAICRAYRESDTPILIGCERECWQIRDPEWFNCYPEAIGGRRWINAGCFMGPRETLINALGELAKLREELGGSVAPRTGRGYADVWRQRHAFGECDQFLWQAAHLTGLLPLKIDDRCRLVANITLEGVQLAANPFCGIDRAKSWLKKPASGRR